MQYNQYLVVGVTPAHNETSIPTQSVVEILFLEAMDADSITPMTIYLQDTSTGGTVPSSLEYDPKPKKAILTPTSPLKSLTKYRLTVLGGANGIRSILSKALLDPKFYEFTTMEEVVEPEAPEEESSLEEPPAFFDLPEVIGVHPQDGAVHTQPNSLKVLFTTPIDPSTVTHESVYLIQKSKPKELNAIDLLTEYSPEQSLLNETDNPIVFSQGNRLVSIDLNERVLDQNKEYTLIIRESVGKEGVTIGMPHAASFHTTFSPLHANPEELRKEMSSFLTGTSEYALYSSVRDVSREGAAILQSRDATIDLTGEIPFALEQYVKTKSAYELALNAHLRDSKVSENTRTLGELSIKEKDESKNVALLLRQLKERIAPWLDELNGRTNRGYARPAGVVKGENIQAYPEFLTRAEFTDL